MRLTLLVFVFCCAQLLAAQIADVVYTSGNIYTANATQEFASAMAILGDELVFVGSDDGVLPHIGPETSVIDLDGKTVLPGLFDPHIHLLEAGAEGGASCTLPWNANDVSELVEALVDCDPQPNSNGWIFSWGHSIYPLLESGQHPLDLLSEAFPEVPVAAMDETSHSAWVNQAALDALGISGVTSDPEGGHIVLDEEGEPFGILLDAAGDLAFAAANATNPNLEQGQTDGLINFGMPAMAAVGITSITEGRTYWDRNYHETWQALHDQGALTLRVSLAMYAYPENDDTQQLQQLTDLFDAGDVWLQARQIKLYVDGIAINGTAAMEEPYVYVFGWPFYSGLNYFTPERLETYISELEQMGYDFHMHAIGNRGVREALDAVEAAQATNGDVGARHQITHLEWVNPNDYARFAELNVTANAQVTAWWSQPNNWSENAYLVGNEVASVMMPIGSIFDAGGRVTLSSDWDVSSFNPFRSIENAVARDPEALPSVADAVDAKTIHAAYSARTDHFTGSLEAGKKADFICVDQDIFSVSENLISETNVTLTVVGGMVVHDEGSPVGAPTSTEQKILIGPTLATQTISVQGVAAGARFQLLHMGGGMVWDQQLDAGVNHIDVTGLAEGTYQVMVTSDTERASKRIVVVR